MQITLNQAELEEAIEDYVRSQININDDQSISIDLKATRGAEGNTATIDIRKGNVKPAKATAKPAYRGNKPGPKPKASQPEPEPEAETEAQDEEVIETTVAPEPEAPDEAIEDGAEGEGEPEPEKAAEEKPARTPGSIFSRAG